MKNLIIIAIILFSTIPKKSNAQNLPLIEGTYAALYLNNGSVVKGKILKVNLHDVKIQFLGKKTTMDIQRSEIDKVEHLHIANGGSLGLGRGIPYGGLGLNFDVRIADYLDLSLGAGTTLVAGVAYGAGVKVYFLPPDQPLRPRFTGMYGINAMVVSDDNVYNEKFAGASFGFGMLYLPIKPGGRVGFDFDLILIIPSSEYEDTLEEMKNTGLYDVTEAGAVNFSIGLRIGI